MHIRLLTVAMDCPKSAVTFKYGSLDRWTPDALLYGSLL